MLRELPQNFYPVTGPEDERERRIAEEQHHYYRALDTVEELFRNRCQQEPEPSGYWISRVEEVLRTLRGEVETVEEE